MKTKPSLSKLNTVPKRRLPHARKRGPATDIGRRRSIAALLTALAGGLCPRTTQAFPDGAQNHFKAATRILNRYGLSVDGLFNETLRHDVLTVTSVPHLETQYDFVVGELNEVSGIEPCYLTTFFQGSAEFTSFEENQAGGILPCTKTAVDANQTTFEELDTNAAGGIVPCSKTTIDGAQTVFELFDPNQAGGIIPCSIVGAERLPDGSLGPVEVTVNDPNLNFTVRIGPRTYRLVDGALVEETPQ